MEKEIQIIMGIIVIGGGIMTISAKNPVHSVINLVITFIGMAGILIYMGLEIIPIIIIIVYVGAIAILFLFVIMMINIKSEELKENRTRYIPIGVIIGIIFVMEVIVVGNKEMSTSTEEISIVIKGIEENYKIRTETNIGMLGEQLYGRNGEILIMGGIILFIGMYGAIILSLLQEKYIKKQDMWK